VLGGLRAARKSLGRASSEVGLHRRPPRRFPVSRRGGERRISNSLLAHHVSTGFGRQLKLAGGKPMLADKQLAFGFSDKLLD